MNIALLNFLSGHMAMNGLVQLKFLRRETFSYQSLIENQERLCKNVCDVAFTGKLCNRPLGMQNRRIRNVAITSSSRWDNHHAPYLARLQNQRRGRYMGGWSAGANNAFQWLQIDLGRPTKIVRISTQGRPTVNQWVTSYYLLYSQDGVYFAFYFERNTRKVGFISRYSCTAKISWLLVDGEISREIRNLFRDRLILGK